MKNKKVTIKLKELAINNEMFHHLIPITINKKKGVLLIDTGASRSIFDAERFKRFKVKENQCAAPIAPAGAGGPVTSNLCILKNIKVDKLELKNLLIGTVDLSHVNNMFNAFKVEPVDGVLGADVLRNYGACLDFKNNTVSFEFNEKKVARENNTYLKKLKSVVNL